MGYFPFPGPMRQQPQSAPPTFIPPRPTTSNYIIDCLHQNTYVWLTNGDSFWFFPTRVEYGEVSGYRWNGSFWSFYGIDPRFIVNVACYPTPTLY